MRATLRCGRPPTAAPRPPLASLAPAARLHLGRRQHGLRLQLEQRLERLEQRAAWLGLGLGLGLGSGLGLGLGLGLGVGIGIGLG